VKETINHDDIVGAIGPRPFEAHKEYAEFIESIKPPPPAQQEAAAGKQEEEAAAADGGGSSSGGLPPNLTPA
jgi:hypothetical protein